jgi:uncharacterized protein YndB with AHSA1/START domain
MLKAIIIIALVTLVPLAGVLIYAATRPDTFRVQRTASINAPAEKIFDKLNDFRHWAGWSPYETKDPAMRKTYSGPATGKGAVYEWDGDKNVGQGRIEIAEAAAPSRLVLNLDMIKPLPANNLVEFTLEPRGDNTTVTWAMTGRAPYIAQVMGLFFDMDRMVGKDFETGLSNLKALTEKPA